MANKGRNIDTNEKSLWDKIASTITPLKKQAQPAEHADEKTIQKPIRNKSAIPASSPTPPVGHNVQKQSSTHSRLDGRTATKLRKGKITVEATIDLHGMTQDQAHHALNQFVMRAFHTHKRCLLVITGKGARSTDGIGVLKRRLPDWLSVPPLNDIVLEHQQAHHKHGGSGAFYLYLKKDKTV